MLKRGVGLVMLLVPLILSQLTGRAFASLKVADATGCAHITLNAANVTYICSPIPAVAPAEVAEGDPHGYTAPYAVAETAQAFHIRRAYTTNFSNPGGGRVQADGTRAWLIYWDPYGGMNYTYADFMLDYFDTISGSEYYGNLSQYGITNIVDYKGSVLDSTPPSENGLWPTGSPLSEADVEGEVIRMLAATGWTATFGKQFTVLLGTNGTGNMKDFCVPNPGGSTSTLWDCSGPNEGADPSTAGQGGLCGYHDEIKYSSGLIPSSLDPNHEDLNFAVVGYGEGHHMNYAYRGANYSGPACSGGINEVTAGNVQYNKCPNSSGTECNIDTALSVEAHDSFEVATDPDVGTGWTDLNGGGEISDLCQYTFQHEVYDYVNGNYLANHYFDNVYYMDLQGEWDNHQAKCTAYGP